jgi:hypothetical protein
VVLSRSIFSALFLRVVVEANGLLKLKLNPFVTGVFAGWKLILFLGAWHVVIMHREDYVLLFLKHY